MQLMATYQRVQIYKETGVMIDHPQVLRVEETLRIYDENKKKYFIHNEPMEKAIKI